ncbi:MAG: hypothetical protein CTR55_03550 [Pseudomonas sp.]|uniref:hypothetical protein n=1 Tax=Pseudomonas sp. TaxID=306 RepID=UPI000CA6981E|nr:hypothetical protein [Pseudomonas sp.]PJI50422.1 MAG: hypothetical protein CTR55_03550 [Pseudomonas sp.]
MGFVEREVVGAVNRVYVHTDKMISREDMIYYQYENSEVARCCGRLKGSSLKLLGESEKIFKDDGPHGLLYKVNPEKIDSKKLEGFLGVVLINVRKVFAVEGNYLKALSASGEYSLEQCLGSEGVNLYRKKMMNWKVACIFI